MSGRGRKNLPDKIKQLKGTDQPCRMKQGKGVNGRKVIKAPPAPKMLSKLGKRLWRETIKELIFLEMLQATDMQMVLAYVLEYTKYLELEQDLNDEGRVLERDSKFGTVSYPNPKQTIATESLRRAQSLAAEFGLTPNARMKMKITTPEEEDPFEKFLNQ